MSVSNNDAASRHEMLMELTAEVVAAYVSNNSVPAGELPNLISDVHAALGRMDTPAAPVVVAEKQKPAVNPKRSIHDDYIIFSSFLSQTPHGISR